MGYFSQSMTINRVVCFVWSITVLGRCLLILRNSVQMSLSVREFKPLRGFLSFLELAGNSEENKQVEGRKIGSRLDEAVV